jgi:hypothetical protein
MKPDDRHCDDSTDVLVMVDNSDDDLPNDLLRVLQDDAWQTHLFLPGTIAVDLVRPQH